MSHGIHMNMEVLALKIIDHHLKKMTNTNIKKDSCNVEYYDEELFANNFEHGWIVVVMLNIFIESMINTIIRDCIQYEGEKLLQANLEEKIEVVYLFYKADLSKIKGIDLWESFKTVTRIRNELVHYKNNRIGYIGASDMGLPGVKFGKNNISILFTRENMTETKNKFVRFCELIVENCGLNINKEASLFDCEDIGNGLASFIY